jgi:L-glyceraldehyde 3-phosphate reductase
VLRRAEVTSVLIGASRLAQIADCVGVVASAALTSEELARIDALVGSA